jgi:prepilin-type N-terminal cleavage/methylation domain-containing protein
MEGEQMLRSQERLARRGFTLVELLVVVAIIGALAGFILPNLMTAQSKARMVECRNKLKGIGALVMQYSNEDGNTGFPFGAGKSPLAFESLQKLVEQYPEDLKSEMFICPDSQVDVKAEKDEKGRYTLTEQSCSYAYLKQKRRTATGTTILLSDDSVKDKDAGVEENHEGGVNVYYADNSVTFLKKSDAFPDSELPEGLVGNHN